MEKTNRNISQKLIVRTMVTLALVMVMVLAVFTPGSAAGVPLTTIVSVNKDVSVTISGTNFPADKTFTVRMGPYGTLGIGGTVVGSKEPSASTSFTATYNIPAALVGASKIAIRFDSTTGGYYSYDWFVNDPASVSSTVTPGPSPTPGPTKVPGTLVVPTISIAGVQQGVSVSIQTSNFPANQTFKVRMGEYGTLGINGTEVGTLESGSGGALSKTFSIPAALADRAKIAIRLESPLGYYSYNWFVNSNYGTGGALPTATPGGPGVTPAPTSTPGTTVPVPGYTGIPTFTISSVVKDSSVTISALNFPPGQTFTVKMGAFGTLGVGGTVVTTYDSGAGGSFSATYTIPASLAGSAKIAIRLESATGYYYSYNWFYNN